MLQHDIDPDYLDAVATKFAVLGQIFTAFGERASVVELVDTLADNDAAGFSKMLDRLDARRLPVFPPATPCLVVADFVIKVFDLGTRVTPVTVLREPLDVIKLLLVFGCQRRTGGARHQAMVLVPPGLKPTERTVVEGDSFIECLRQHNLVEAGELLDEQQIEFRMPNGERLNLCPPPGLR
jgi:hypothetical protein